MQKKQQRSDREKSGRSTDNELCLESVIAEEALPPKGEGLRRVKEKLRQRMRQFGQWYLNTDGAHLLTCFTLPAVIMILIYSLTGTFPTGPSSVLVLDLNGQYVYFFEALRDWVWGDGSILYSFSRQMGGEFVGIYAYYLASPLSYIVALFPKEMITEALYFIFVLKCGLSGLTFGYYIYKRKLATPATTVIFSVLYALSGYAVVMQHNTMWIDNLFLLPLVALGIDLLISEGKYKLFTFSLIFAVMSNYYIGYMTCIFVFLYFFYSFFSRSREARNPRKLNFHFVRSISKIAVFSAIAIGIACLIIIPAYYSLTFGKDEFSTPKFDYVLRYDLLDLISKFFFASYDTVRPEGLPFVYCGTVVMFAIPLYFGNKKIDGREKFCGAFLALIFLASFTINTLDMVWHGFQAPNWLNYRYSFMFCFILLVMAARGFDNIRALTRRTVMLTGGILVFFLILFQEFDLLEFNSELEWLDETLPLVLNAALILAWVLTLISVLKKKHILPFRHLAGLLAILICVEALLGGIVNLVQLNVDVTISWRRTYRNFINRWQEPFDEVKESDDSAFYRMESTYHRKVNDPYALGYRGLSGSSSTLNANTIAWLYYMGISSRSHWSQYVDSCPAIDSLFSVKYVFTDADDEVSDLYVPYYTNGDVSAYLNPYALPLAYGVSDNVNDITFTPPQKDRVDEDGNVIKAPIDEREYIDTTSAPIRINRLIATMLGLDEPVEIFKALDHDIDFYNSDRIRNTSVGIVEGHKFYSKNDKNLSAYVNYKVKNLKQAGEVYCYLPTLYLRDVDLILNGEEFGKYMSNATHGVISLGYFEEGEDITLSLSLSEKGTYIGNEDCYFFTFDEEVFKESMAELSDSGYEITKCTEDSFSGNIKVLEGEETIITSIPYDAGWQVYCDGVAVEGYEVLDALLAFELPTGEHSLELRYMPREYKAAALISAVSCGIFAAILVGDYLITRKRRRLAAIAETEE